MKPSTWSKPRQKPLFKLGKLVATPAALDLLKANKVSPGALYARHARCDWGEVDPEDKRTNDLALKTGARLFSVYKVSETEKVWVITEADRSSTTILRPSEY